MTISWADALDKAIEQALYHGPQDVNDCPLCVKNDSRHAEWNTYYCSRCPINQKRNYYVTYDIRHKTRMGILCHSWGKDIKYGNKKALRRARQLSAYIRKHPRKWMHMEPEALAKAVRKVKV
jgi:hypothetical protein